MKPLFALMVVMFLVTGLQGCETVKGMGRDLEKAGGAIEKAAD